MNAWTNTQPKVTFAPRLHERNRRSHKLVVAIIVVATVGEAICLVRFGFMAKDFATVYLICAAWVKEWLYEVLG
jgi:hypothetical protein